MISLSSHALGFWDPMSVSMGTTVEAAPELSGASDILGELLSERRPSASPSIFGHLVTSGFWACRDTLRYK